jgi:ribosomal protein L40E
MFCKKCGTQNPDNNYVCISCGEKLHAPEKPLEIVNNFEPVHGTEPVKPPEEVKPAPAVKVDGVETKFCNKCGERNEKNAAACKNCGGSFLPPPPKIMQSTPVNKEPIANYLIQNIIATVLCCVPLGIAGIIYAAQVNSKLASGDRLGALDAADKAKKYFWWSFWIGLVVGMIGFVMGIIGEMAKTGTK